MKQELVKDWMTREIITATPGTTLPRAHRMMADHNIRRLPILEGDNLVGIVTLGDIREAAPSKANSLSLWEINHLLAELKLKEVMTPHPITITPDTTIDQVVKIMLENKISGLPVVDGSGKVVGIITESDVFRLVYKTWHEQQ